MRARVPASSANLGPGFDTLALALSLYVEVTVEPAGELEIVATGEGADIPSSPHHLAARVVRRVAGHDRFRITLHSEIPVGRGLGSSAALAAAAAAAAGAEDPLGVAAEVDGHPENAAASVLGGLVAATTIAGRAVARRLPLDDELSFVVIVPDRKLPTKEARAALPGSLSYADSTFNLGRLAILLPGLADHRQLLPEAMDDRLHQRQRTPLFPESAPLLAGLRSAGALATAWSGAGPSLLAVSTRAAAPALRDAADNLLSEHGVGGRALHLEPDRRGLVVEE